MAKQQPTLFSFFNKTKSNYGQNPTLSNANQANVAAKPKSVFIGDKELNALDLVWAKLEGYPWWPAIVFEHPVEKKISQNKFINVQFFEDPPTRSWVKTVFVKHYGAPELCGIKSNNDAEWLKAKSEADQIQSLPSEERRALIVATCPTDDESSNSEADDFESSKENVDVNNSVKRVNIGKDGPQPKRRKVMLLPESDVESDDEYKPDKCLEKSLSETDDSLSSGLDESQISEIEPSSDSDASPVKKTPKRKAAPKCAKKNISFTPKSNSSFSASASASPRVTPSTKAKLNAFAANNTPSKPASSSGDIWPYMKLDWLKTDKMKDAEGRPVNHPDYDPRTLLVPDDFLNKQTPAMRQWWEIKKQHFDTVLFFKMGKFYELFHMDAIMSIQELGLLMMKGEQAHTGFPEISFGRYSSLLINRGYKVARVEQIETPEMMENRCKKLSRPTKFDRVVRREVCQLTSLGTRMPSVLDGEIGDAEPKYLLAVTETQLDGPGGHREYGVAFVDVSVGVFKLAQFKDDRHAFRFRTLLAQYPPCQVLYEKSCLSQASLMLLKPLVSSDLIDALTSATQYWDSAKTLRFFAESRLFLNADGELEIPEVIKEAIDEGDTLGRTCKESHELCVRSLGALFWYLRQCLIDEDVLSRKMFQAYSPPDVDHASKLAVVPPDAWKARHMILDGMALRNLEVFENSLDGSEDGTLLQTLNNCCTSFGKRLLRQWICSPLCNVSAINDRLNAIEDLRANPDLVATIRPMLKSIPDLEKLLTKIHCLGLKRGPDHPESKAILYEIGQYSQRKVNDFLSLLDGFRIVIDVFDVFKSIEVNLKSKLLRMCVTYKSDGGNLEPMEEHLQYFSTAFDPVEAKREGKIIPSEGVDVEYDEASARIRQTDQELQSYLKEQCKQFGAKVTFWGNDKKRFQLEVPDHAARKAGSAYELVSQRKGFKRFWTEETRKFLAEMTEAEEKRDSALQDIARRIFSKFSERHDTWKIAVDCLSTLDVLVSMTEFSLKGESTRPIVEIVDENQKPFIEIRGGRHPCSIELFFGGDFIPNDTVVGLRDQMEDSHSPLVLVTGPNMGGKSTLMRQTALLCILAQMGCFVPATSCRLSVVDWIFTRLGASDRIYEGESTFYVELAETASILRHATRHSLVIVDELGRGTATYDGLAIARAVAEELTMTGPRSLFSTHYHALVSDLTGCPSASLGHMACIVEDAEEPKDPSKEAVTFLYKFVHGSCPKSFGFNAARLAGVPEDVIRRASRKSKEFESINLKKSLFKQMCKFTSLNCSQTENNVSNDDTLRGICNQMKDNVIKT